MNKRAWPRAVLLDLDGTLADTLPDIAGALSDLLVENGYRPFGADAVRRMVGGGVPKLVARALRALGEPVEEARHALLVGRFLELYAPRAARLTRLFPGALELLDALRRQDVRLGVCTNKPEAVTRAILSELGVAGLFGTVVGGDTVGAKKPDPGPVLAALERLHCGPADALMVGDSAADAGAARAAGVAVIVVSFGYSRMPVAEIDADGVIDSFAGLPRAMERLAPAALQA